jgi:hypothetical protein
MKRNSSAAGSAQPTDQEDGRLAANRIQSVVVLAYPYAQNAAGRVVPLGRAAVRRVSPYGRQAAVLLLPYAQQAASRIRPAAQTATQRSARAAQDAARVVGPRLDNAYLRLSPVLLSARGKVNDELAPRLSGAWGLATASPVVIEARKRGRAAMAAARGELSLPVVATRQPASWPKRIAVAAGAAGAAGAGVVAVRRWLGLKDAEQQETAAAGRPTDQASDVTQDVTASPATDHAVQPETLGLNEPQSTPTDVEVESGSPTPDGPVNGEQPTQP